MKNDADSHPRSSSDPGCPSRSPTLEWAVSSGRVEQVFTEVEIRLRRRRRRQMGAAVSGLAALVVGAFVSQFNPGAGTAPPLAPSSAMVLRTANQVLPDGSVVELKDDARISIEYSVALRRVILQHGEGHFQVAKNPERPFVVVAGGIEVRAVGTAFSVQLGAKAVEVLVTQGRVAVQKQAGIGAQEPRARDQSESETSLTRSLPHSLIPLLVEAGKLVIVEMAPEVAAAPPRVLAVSEAELNDRLAWRIPKLEFAGTPLAQAIPMFNEHTRVQLVLGDPSLGSLELSGIMRADNTDSLLRLLRDEFGINAERRGDEIVLRR